MPHYPPGTLAAATVRGVPNVRIMRTASRRELWYSAERHGQAPDGFDSIRWHGAEHITDIRPLPVLELPPGAMAGWPILIDALRQAREKTGFLMIFDGLIDQIERQTDLTPTPTEPTGPAARVLDNFDREWALKSNGVWACLGYARSTDWDGLVSNYGPVQVLS